MEFVEAISPIQERAPAFPRVIPSSVRRRKQSQSAAAAAPTQDESKEITAQLLDEKKHARYNRAPKTKNPVMKLWYWTTGKYGPPETPTPITWYNWPLHINHVNFIHSLIMPFVGIYGAYYVPLRWETAVFALTFLFLTGTAVTAGYHRLWSHRSFEATLPLQLYLLFFATTAFEGSAKYWATEHRAHHRYIDTDKDPYSAHKGLVWSHIGWVVMNQDQCRIHRIGTVDTTDLKEEKLLSLHHQFYWELALLLGYGMPALVASLWGDAWGGLLYAGLWKIQAANHSIFCVNSLAHYLGDQPYSDAHTARNNLFTALLTFGEGWHNLHHTHPTDWRNGIAWYEWDPTKWLIWLWGKMGLAYDLRSTKQNELEKSKQQMLQKRADLLKNKIDWGTPFDQLPVISWDEYQNLHNDSGRKLIAIEGVVYDVTDFINVHPGGKNFMRFGLGKDATPMFNGGVYKHSSQARNLMGDMRIALLEGGMEVESWKKGAVTADTTISVRQPLEIATPVAVAA